jgi:hypothetical protein
VSVERVRHVSSLAGLLKCFITLTGFADFQVVFAPDTYSAIVNISAISTKGTKKIPDPCHGETAAMVSAGPASDAGVAAAGVDTDTAEAESEGSDSFAGAEGGVSDFAGASAIAVFAGGTDAGGATLATGPCASCAEAIPASGADAGGATLAAGPPVETTSAEAVCVGPAPAEAVTPGLAEIGPAHETASQEKPTATSVAERDFDMMYPFRSGGWYLINRKFTVAAQLISLCAPGRHEEARMISYGAMASCEISRLLILQNTTDL